MTHPSIVSYNDTRGIRVVTPDHTYFFEYLPAWGGWLVDISFVCFADRLHPVLGTTAG